uniref:Uncharacterized protein n=1 Tax=Timema monikensis TaxID=170555 RepID=A0A7R9HIW6_9NEOP|nr:unnamed protein product [Timema monikensis]
MSKPGPKLFYCTQIPKSRELAKVGLGKLYLEEVYTYFCGGEGENHFGKTTLSTPELDSNLYLPVINSPVYCEGIALDNASTEAVSYKIVLSRSQSNSSTDLTHSARPWRSEVTPSNLIHIMTQRKYSGVIGDPMLLPFGGRGAIWPALAHGSQTYLCYHSPAAMMDTRTAPLAVACGYYESYDGGYVPVLYGATIIRVKLWSKHNNVVSLPDGLSRFFDADAAALIPRVGGENTAMTSQLCHYWRPPATTPRAPATCAVLCARLVLDDVTEINPDILIDVLKKYTDEVKLRHKLEPSFLVVKGNGRQLVELAKAIFSKTTAKLKSPSISGFNIVVWYVMRAPIQCSCHSSDVTSCLSRGNVPKFAWMESRKQFWKNHPQYTPLGSRLPISVSLDYCESSALDNNRRAPGAVRARTTTILLPPDLMSALIVRLEDNRPPLHPFLHVPGCVLITTKMRIAKTRGKTQIARTGSIMWISRVGSETGISWMESETGISRTACGSSAHPRQQMAVQSLPEREREREREGNLLDCNAHGGKPLNHACARNKIQSDRVEWCRLGRLFFYVYYPHLSYFPHKLEHSVKGRSFNSQYLKSMTRTRHEYLVHVRSYYARGMCNPYVGALVMEYTQSCVLAVVRGMSYGWRVSSGQVDIVHVSFCMVVLRTVSLFHSAQFCPALKGVETQIAPLEIEKEGEFVKSMVVHGSSRRISPLVIHLLICTIPTG